MKSLVFDNFVFSFNGIGIFFGLLCLQLFSFHTFLLCLHEPVHLKQSSNEVDGENDEDDLQELHAPTISRRFFLVLGFFFVFGFLLLDLFLQLSFV